jgi:branched-subunit amino acid transport protein
VSSVWVAVIAVGAATVALKAIGPVFLRGRELPAHLAQMIDLLAPVLLAALVVTQTVGGDGRIEIDERALGIAGAAAAIALRAHVLVVPVVAAIVAAVARAA